MQSSYTLEMPTDRQARAAAKLFAALGDETRLRIVARLSSGDPVSIAALSSGSKITRQAISKHLRVMEKAKLIHRERSGRESLCRLNPRRLDEAQLHLAAISKQWDDAIGRLRALVEE
jgi:DNA-binding transcriptional ArsR family regulator